MNMRTLVKSFKKRLPTAYYFKLLVTLITLCAIPFAASSADKKTLPLASFELPPFSYTKNGMPAGASVEFIQELFSRMGYETTITFLPFKRGKKMTANGKYAGLFTIVKSPERMEHYHYPNPITVNKNVFFKRKTMPLQWDTMEDLKNYKLGLTEGYSYPPVLQKALDKKAFKTIDRLTSKTPTLLQLRKLAENRIDFFMTERAEGLFYIKLYAPEFDAIDYNHKSVGPVKKWYFVFSKKWPNAEKLVHEFNAELEKMILEGRQEAIFGNHDVEWAKDEKLVDW